MAKYKLDGTDIEIEVRDEDASSYANSGWILQDERNGVADATQPVSPAPAPSPAPQPVSMQVNPGTASSDPAKQ